MRVELDDLSRAEVRALLREHVDDMYEITPPESVHALDLDELRAADVTFWTVWEGQDLLGCGALRELSADEGEIKTMRTPARKRRRGAGRAILQHMVAEARARGYERLYLETGSMAAFAPARGLYESAGFVPCGPFGPYHEDPNLYFMTLPLTAVAGEERDDAPRAKQD